MVRIVKVSDLYFGSRRLDINCGCDGIPLYKEPSQDFQEPSNEELERIEVEGVAEGISSEILKSTFQNVLVSTTFRIK